MFDGHWNQYGKMAIAFDDSIMFDLTYEEVTQRIEKEKAKKEEKENKEKAKKDEKMRKDI
jgi:hypothetical protein